MNKIAGWLQVGAFFFVPTLVTFVFSIVIFTRAKRLNAPRRGALLGIVGGAIGIAITVIFIILYFGFIIQFLGAIPQIATASEDEVLGAMIGSLITLLVGVIVMIILGIASFILRILSVVAFFKEEKLLKQEALAPTTE